MCIDADALFRWQVALVDAMASLDDPRSVEQLFASCTAYAGGWACWERSLRALRMELSSMSCSNLQKGVLFTPVAVRFWRPGFCLLLNTLVSLNLRKISESINSYLFDRPAVGPAELV